MWLRRLFQNHPRPVRSSISLPISSLALVMFPWLVVPLGFHGETALAGCVAIRGSATVKSTLGVHEQCNNNAYHLFTGPKYIPKIQSKHPLTHQKNTFLNPKPTIKTTWSAVFLGFWNVLFGDYQLYHTVPTMPHSLVATLVTSVARLMLRLHYWPWTWPCDDNQILKLHSKFRGTTSEILRQVLEFWVWGIDLKKNTSKNIWTYINQIEKIITDQVIHSTSPSSVSPPDTSAACRACTATSACCATDAARALLLHPFLTGGKKEHLRTSDWNFTYCNRRWNIM